MMESYPDTIIVSNDVGVGLHHIGERYNCHQKLHSHILSCRKYVSHVATMINSSFIQDH